MLLLNQPCNDWRVKSCWQQQRQEKMFCSARGFCWVKGQDPYFDARVLTRAHQGIWLNAFKAIMQETNAKRRYIHRVLERLVWRRKKWEILKRGSLVTNKASPYWNRVSFASEVQDHQEVKGSRIMSCPW